jgi:NAD(P)-dependent dehydrogenase (short-subunit alcohol dehydrogenase family)
VSKEEDILNAFSEVERVLGGVDILVNNAGVVHESLLSGISLLQQLRRPENDTALKHERLLAAIIEIQGPARTPDFLRWGTNLYTVRFPCQILYNLFSSI